MMKQLFLPIIIIIAATSLAVVATYADFSDVEVSQGNYVGTGSLDLQLGDTLPYPGGSSIYQPDEDYGADPLGDSVEGTWDRYLGYPDGMEPGDYITSMVKIRNVGDDDDTCGASGLDIICHNENTAPPGGPLDKDTKMIISVIAYHNTFSLNLLTDGNDDWRIQDIDGDGMITLDDWEHDPIIGLPPPPPGSQAFLEMTVIFDDNVGDKYKGCATMMTLNFALY
jgi:predicted ribosomally synthesized peptide with SipW-like signal peptide